MRAYSLKNECQYIDVTRDELSACFATGVVEKAAARHRFVGTRSSNIEGRLARLVLAGVGASGDERLAAVVVAKQHERDFYAWTSTFLPTFLPVSSLVRVLADEDVPMCWSATSCRRGSAGAVLAAAMAITEVAAYRLGNTLSNGSMLGAVLSTYSFVRGRSEHLGYKASEWQLGKRWDYTRNVMRQRATLPSVDEIERVWEFGTQALALLSGRGAQRKLFPVNDVREIDAIAQSPLVAARPDLINAMAVNELDEIAVRMRGTREERVMCFLDGVERVKSVGLPRGNHGERSQLMCGYLASLLSPGRLEYLDLVSTVFKELPLAMIWYGMCCGIQAGEMDRRESFMAENNGLGFRIVKEVEMADDVLNTPNCDVALTELNVLVMEDHLLAAVPRKSLNSMSVELIPCVNTTIAMSRLEDDISSVSMANDEVRLWVKRVNEIADALRDAVEEGPFRQTDDNSRRRRKR